MKISNFIQKRSHVSNVVDKRSKEGGLINITLKPGFFFKDQPGVNRESFSNLRAASAGSSKNNVFKNARKVEHKVTKTGKLS